MSQAGMEWECNSWISIFQSFFLPLYARRTKIPWVSFSEGDLRIRRVQQRILVLVWSHPYMTTGKTIALTRQTFVGKVMSLLFNMLSRLVRAFLPRSKHLLISWLQSPPAVILEPPQDKVCHCFHCFPICHEVMGPDAMILVLWMLSFKPTFSLSSFTVIKRRFGFSSLFAIMVVSSVYPEKAMAPHSSTLAWKIPWMEEPGRLQSMGSLRVRHDWETSLSLFTFLHWRRKW